MTTKWTWLLGVLLCCGVIADADAAPNQVVIESAQSADEELRQQVIDVVNSNKNYAVTSKGAGWVLNYVGTDWIKHAEDAYVTYKQVDMILNPKEEIDLLDLATIIGAMVDSSRRKAEETKQKRALGNVLAALLKAWPEDPSIQRTADRYANHLDRYYSGGNAAYSIRNSLYAIRLGLEPTVWDEFPGLRTFITKNYIDDYATLQGHKFSVNEDDVPMIMYEGNLEPWTDVQSKISLDKDGMLTDHYYTKDGLVPGQPDQQLVVFTTVDPAEYGGRHLLEIVSFKPHYIPHSWVRLKDKHGNAYSAGWVSDDSWWKEMRNWISPDVSKGRVLSPDPYELTATKAETLVTPIEISEEQYFEMMAFLDEYQQDPDVCFEGQTSLGTTTCVSFVREVMRILDLPPPTREGWFSDADDPNNFYGWQQDFNLNREKRIKKLEKNGASKDEIDAARYEWIDVD